MPGRVWHLLHTSILLSGEELNTSAHIHMVLSAMPSIAGTEQHTGRRKLTFDNLVLEFSLMLLSSLCNRCNCLVEKKPAVKSLVFT